MAIRLEDAGVDATHAQQVGDESIEAVDLIAHRGQELDTRLGVVRHVVAEVGGDRADRRERRPQIVGHGAQQRRALHVDLFEFLGAGRLARELRTLVAQLFDLLVEGADTLRSFGHLGATAHQTTHELSDEKRDRKERGQFGASVDVGDIERSVRADETEVEGQRGGERSGDRSRRTADDRRADHDDHQNQGHGC